MFCHCSGIHRRFEGGRRHRHSEVEAFATFHDAADISYIREIAVDDFGAKCGKGFRSIVAASGHRSDRDPFPPQEFNDFKTYRSHLSCGSCHESGACDGTRLMCCGIHTPSKIAALPSPPAGQIEIRPRFFPPFERSFPKVPAIRAPVAAKDVPTSPQRRFFAHGSRAQVFNRPVTVGRMVLREVRPEREPCGGEGFPVGGVRKRRDRDELALVEPVERGVHHLVHPHEPLRRQAGEIDARSLPDLSPRPAGKYRQGHGRPGPQRHFPLQPALLDGNGVALTQDDGALNDVLQFTDVPGPVGAKRVLLAGLTLHVVAVSLYLVTREVWHFYAVALIFGFAYGGVMPLYAIVVRDYFGAWIMGTIFGAVGFASTLGMALGPWVGGWLYDAFGSYAWLFIGSCGIGLGAVAIACTFGPPRSLPAALLAPSVTH
jgi:hypothetical protein